MHGIFSFYGQSLIGHIESVRQVALSDRQKSGIPAGWVGQMGAVRMTETVASVLRLTETGQLPV